MQNLEVDRIGMLTLNGRMLDLVEHPLSSRIRVDGNKPGLSLNVVDPETIRPIEGVILYPRIVPYIPGANREAHRIMSPVGKVIATGYVLNNEVLLKRTIERQIEGLKALGYVKSTDVAWVLTIMHSLLDERSLQTLGLTEDHLIINRFGRKPTVRGNVSLDDPQRVFANFSETYDLKALYK